MKVTLLGGSNSLYRCGIRTGIQFHRNVELNNLALGATSSLQNLSCLIQNRDLILNSDLIISESNVNDSFNQAYLNILNGTVESTIREYYAHLSSFNKPVFCLILPLNFDKPGIIEKEENFNKLRMIHLECIHEYGFHYIDLYEYLCRKAHGTTFDLIMAECRHAKPIFMHDIMKSVISFFLKNMDSIVDVERKSVVDLNEYYSVEPEELADINGLSIELKNNSLFDVKVVRFKSSNDMISFPKHIHSMKLVGLGTWCEKNSPSVCFNFSNGEIVKSFNELYSFNEINYTDDFFGEKLLYVSTSNKSITEKTLLERKKQVDFANMSSVAFTSFLFRTGDIKITEYTEFSGIKNLSTLVPEIKNYSFDTNYCDNNSASSKGINSLADVKKIMSLADELSHSNADIAFELAKSVFKFVSYDEEQVAVMQGIRRKTMEKDYIITKNVLVNNTNGWKFLFSGDHKQFDFLTQESVISEEAINAFNSNVAYRTSLCSELNIQYLHVVFPCKPIVMKNKLPEKFMNINSLFDYFKPNEKTIYPIKELISCEHVFSPNDTHTTPRGSWIILQEILRRFSIEIKNEPCFERASTIGDLNRMLGDLEQEPLDKFIGLENIKYKVLDVTNKMGLRGNSGLIRIIRNPNAVYGKTLLIFGDSFFNNNLNSQLACFFENIIFFRSPIIIEHVVRTIQPDYLLTGQAERYLSSSLTDKGATDPMIKYMNGNFYEASKVPKAFYIALDAIFSRHTNSARYEHWTNIIDEKLKG